MSLAGQWSQLVPGLPEGWAEARVQLDLEEVTQIDRAFELLGPLQPFRAGPGAVSLRLTRDGSGPSVETIRRALGRLDSERLHGTLTVLSSELEAAAPGAAETTLAASWDAALTTVPADWSDLLGEVELDSSDYVDRGALHMGPVNPRRVGMRTAFRFRSANSFGYGASAGMVRRCLERCDAEGITGRVTILRVLSDTHPVGTQGPVWQIDGEMV